MYNDFFDGNLGSHQKIIVMKISKKNLTITKTTLFSFKKKINNGTDPITTTGDPTISLITTVNMTRP